MATEKDEIIAEYEKELRRLQRKNIQLKTHMDVLIRTPYCEAAEKIRKTHRATADFAEHVLNLN